MCLHLYMSEYFKKQTPKIRHFIQLFMKQVTNFEFTRSFAKEELTFKSSYFKLEISSLQIKRNPTVNYKPNDNTSGKKIMFKCSYKLVLLYAYEIIGQFWI